MSGTTDAKLTELGVPNNILIRTAYRAIYRLVYTTMYIGITVAAVVMRKDRLEILNSMSLKLGLGPVAPTQ